MGKRRQKNRRNIKSFQELLEIVIKNLEDAKKDKGIKEETLSTVNEGLSKIRKEIEPKVEEMIEKVSKIKRLVKFQQRFWGCIGFILIIIAHVLFYKAIKTIFNK